MEKKSLYLISGFLGAGKTTFMKNLFNIFRDKKIAVIVNEFGKEGIDGIVLQKEGIKISQINNGSIFCVCRSDLFIDALIKASEYEIDMVLVESSGLADPTGMPDILKTIRKLKGDVFDYRGNIGIVDANNFLKVFKTAVAVKSQIISSNLIIMNKIDLVEEENIKNIENVIKEINPKAEIIKTTYCRIEDPTKILNLNTVNSMSTEGLLKKKTIGQQKILITIDGDFEKEVITRWLNEFAHMTYRIKGFASLKDDFYHIDGVNTNIHFKKIDRADKKPVLVVLGSGTKPIKKTMVNAWKQYFKTPINME